MSAPLNRHEDFFDGVYDVRLAVESFLLAYTRECETSGELPTIEGLTAHMAAAQPSQPRGVGPAEFAAGYNAAMTVVRETSAELIDLIYDENRRAIS